MNPIPEPLLTTYLANPLNTDEEVRLAMGIPDDAYYTVSVWPTAGHVRVGKRKSRVVRTTKISKSS